MHVAVIGGTRHLGPDIVPLLIEEGEDLVLDRVDHG
jgi:hypothetical protein